MTSDKSIIICPSCNQRLRISVIASLNHLYCPKCDKILYCRNGKLTLQNLSNVTGLFIEKVFEDESYLVTNNIHSFCECMAMEGRAGLEFTLAEEECVSKKIYSISGKYMKNSPYKGYAVDQTIVCSSCLLPIRSYICLPQQCPSCGSTGGIKFYNNTELVITSEDIEYIRDFFQAKANKWWISHVEKTAYCDSCDNVVIQKNSYLNGTKLLCSTCCEKVLSEFDNKRKQGRSIDSSGLLRLARKYHKTGILGSY